jgi:ribonuclease-3
VLINVADLSDLQRKIDINFKRLDIFELALIHSSLVNEKPGVAQDSNERLEFLGDAVLGLVIAQILFHDFPESSEGELTRLRSALVRRDTLAQIARIIGLGEYLSLGKGEEAGGGRDKPANLAGAFEALIAAIYLDQDLTVARNFILKLYGSEIYKQAHIGAGADYKSRLQEILQAERQITPNYHMVQSSGPDHAKQFIVEVRLGETVLGRGTGKSKKQAEMEAAHAALKDLDRSQTSSI